MKRKLQKYVCFKPQSVYQQFIPKPDILTSYVTKQVA